MRIGKLTVFVLFAVILSLPAGAVLAAPAAVDLTEAVVVSSVAADSIELQAANLLRWEVQRRTGNETWGLTRHAQPATALPADDVPAIVVGSLERMPPMPEGLALPEVHRPGEPAPAEGYLLGFDAKARPALTICIIGNDRRGALYGVGQLLRSLDWAEGSVGWRVDLDPETGGQVLWMSTAPAHPIRGMQLGYRALNDTYDAWDVGQYTQYIRDLIVFGVNAVELIPGIRPGAKGPADPSPVMPMTPWDMTMAVSAVMHAYDIDVWYWLPLADGGALNERVKAQTLYEREELFRTSPHIDHIFVPGGDPGNTPPDLLMPYLKDLSALLHKYHPQAGVWVSTQGFEIENRDYFYEYLEKNQPDWLTGVVYGPWAKDTIEHTRQAVPAKYPIRRYPDITHTVRNQYPFPNWDEPWFQAYERQPIMPRPTQQAHIARLFMKFSQGAICYSDGTGDDLNKFVWAAMMWDPKADLNQVLREWARYFIGPDYASDVAQGMLMLERNWVGPALTSPQVPKTLAHWQALERRASPEVMANWRFQQGLIRAYGDAYVQKRLEQETALLERGYAELRKARQVGPDAAMDAAESILKNVNPVAAAPTLHARILELADMLNRSIGMQLSIEGQHSFRIDRGALLDSIDRPISDASWLLNQVSVEPVWERHSEAAPLRLRDLPTRQAKLDAIDALFAWEDPGPGSFYDNLGDGAHNRQPHVVPGPGWKLDPGYVLSAQDEHGGADFPAVARSAWYTQAQTLYETPLRMRYTGLDLKASYVFKATYTGRFNSTSQLHFDDQKIGEPLKSDRSRPTVHAFDVPKSATADGVLEVKWTRIAGRGVQIAEAWLIKKQ